jgi:hypothetical protein
MENQMNHLLFDYLRFHLALFTLQFIMIEFHELKTRDLIQMILHLHIWIIRRSLPNNPLLPLAWQHDTIPLAGWLTQVATTTFQISNHTILVHKPSHRNHPSVTWLMPAILFQTTWPSPICSSLHFIVPITLYGPSYTSRRVTVFLECSTSFLGAFLAL